MAVDKVVAHTKTGRTISVLLTTDGVSFGYVIRVSDKHACTGLNYKRAIDAYRAAIIQLQQNEDSNSLDCPDPFMEEDDLDELMTSLAELGLRDNGRQG